MGSNRFEPKKSYLVKISRKGYEPVEVSNQYQSMNGWFWANLVFGGIIGAVVDNADGTSSKLGPDDIKVMLPHRRTG